MATENYTGFCPTCRHCDLTSVYKFLYSTSFTCTRYNRSVKSDEKVCNRFEPDRNRTNDVIERYIKG